MTSNLGSAQIFEHLPTDSREALKERVMNEVRSHFRYAFCQLLDPVCSIATSGSKLVQVACTTCLQLAVYILHHTVRRYHASKLLHHTPEQCLHSLC